MTTPYRPSNGSEGEGFIEAWCGNCIHDRDHREGEGPSCDIVARTLVFDVTDPEYPAEWIVDDDGKAKCTAFRPDTEEITARDRDDQTVDMFGGDE